MQKKIRGWGVLGPAGDGGGVEGWGWPIGRGLVGSNVGGRG